eukprot:7993989-Alexandrium_andersonii.AAC.1
MHAHAHAHARARARAPQLRRIPKLAVTSERAIVLSAWALMVNRCSVPVFVSSAIVVATRTRYSRFSGS